MNNVISRFPQDAQVQPRAQTLSVRSLRLVIDALAPQIASQLRDDKRWPCISRETRVSPLRARTLPAAGIAHGCVKSERSATMRGYYGITAVARRQFVPSIRLA